ncbi:MAG TPA: energy transducer TonB [Candidatus Coatesbacteria bacterium]|nr:energy transducer TonB [Candidatus Coatesbacteria bacterium]
MSPDDKKGWSRLSRFLLLSLLVNLLLLMWLIRVEVRGGSPPSGGRTPTVLMTILTERASEPQRLASIRQLLDSVAEPIVVASEDIRTVEEESEPEAEAEPVPPAVETFEYRYRRGSPSVIIQPVLVDGRNDPVMPESLASSKWEGEVTLGLLIDAQGRLVDLWVEESSGREDADRDAVACYRNTRWQPATVDGRPVICRLFVSVPYKLAYQTTRG